MKKIILSLGILVFFLTSFKVEEVDIYSVIRVVGSINHIENGKDLFTGDKVRSNEKLKFATSQSKAAVISRLKGRFILTASNNTKLGLMPAMNNVSSRAGKLINAIDFKNHFSGNYLVFPNYKVEVNTNIFPMNENNFFFMRYVFNGEEISKKMSFEGDKLIISEKELLQVDGKSIVLEEGVLMSFFHRNSKENTSLKITDFNPIFAQEDILKIETKIILEEYSDKTSKEKIEEITAYFNENYGKSYEENLNEWLKYNFKLEE